MKKLKSILGIMIFAIMIISLNDNAFAVPCSQGDVSDKIGCQNGTTNNDFVSGPLTVNTNNFFGFNDWKYLEKADVDDEKGTIEYETISDVDWIVSPDDAWPDSTGTWFFSSSVWSTFEDVMIVVKTGPAFSGYLMNNSLQYTSGTWDSGAKDLSHLTLYARGETPIPEPGTLLLLGAGLMGIAALGSKKFKK